MNKEGQSYQENVSGLSRSEQQPNINTPVPTFRIVNPDRPTFVPDPTLKEAPGGVETAQKLLNALDSQMANEQRKASPNIFNQLMLVAKRVLRRP